ncbi:hypothetical protein E2C01_023772 [Portunus trituberculatus]|uniref:Uncharacterized protein n=1 Tax=Portunus trituberculatus TaxID=210409 RepID=A0A5B7ECI2_PORTR|nr:hypothetical protein [Portunus trituberculatus]
MQTRREFSPSLGGSDRKRAPPPLSPLITTTPPLPHHIHLYHNHHTNTTPDVSALLQRRAQHTTTQDQFLRISPLPYLSLTWSLKRASSRSLPRRRYRGAAAAPGGAAPDGPWLLWSAAGPQWLPACPLHAPLLTPVLHPSPGRNTEVVQSFLVSQAVSRPADVGGGAGRGSGLESEVSPCYIAFRTQTLII